MYALHVTDDFCTYQGCCISLHVTEYITTCHGRNRVTCQGSFCCVMSRMILGHIKDVIYHYMSRSISRHFTDVIVSHVTDHIVYMSRMILGHVKDAIYHYMSRSISRHVTDVIVSHITDHIVYMSRMI